MTTIESQKTRVPSRWPLVLLALPAAVATWTGWVDLGSMAGFGVVRPLPGILDSFEINTAITLPIGVEAYAAYALGTWLGAQSWVTTQTRRFAMWSAVGSLLLGCLGQVAYHLLVVQGFKVAPWQITAAVSSMPVLVLGLGAALGHLKHRDAAAAVSSVEVALTAGSEVDAALGGSDSEPVPMDWDGVFPERDEANTEMAWEDFPDEDKQPERDQADDRDQYEQAQNELEHAELAGMKKADAIRLALTKTNGHVPSAQEWLAERGVGVDRSYAYDVASGRSGRRKGKTATEQERALHVA